MEIDGVIVTATNFAMSVTEARNYIEYVESKVDDPLMEIKVTLCDDGKVDVDYILQARRFERIRRITGYLTGDLNTWNNSKRAEESQRVKHGVNFN